MLNTRYLIVPGDGGQPEAVLRPTANGAAWFVDTIAVAGSPQQEIDLLGETDLKRTAVIAEKDKPYTQGWTASPADTAARTPSPSRNTVPTTSSTNTPPPQRAWRYSPRSSTPTAGRPYVDGAEAPCFRADYVLRAMRLPAGQHTVEWKFRAPGWTAAEAVTLVLIARDPARSCRCNCLLDSTKEERENNPDE